VLDVHHFKKPRNPQTAELTLVCLCFLVFNSGEKALESSRILRRHQSAEYGDVSDSGRKVDCLFSYHGIELSNIELKTPDITPRDIAIQNRKNVRLARAIQEAHAESGAPGEPILMADVSGNWVTRHSIFFFSQDAYEGSRTNFFLVLVVFRGCIQGFIGTFYRVLPMGEIQVAGKTTEETVQLPTTEGGMELFLEGPSLAILFNFMVS
jgi:hypothetical protein